MMQCYETPSPSEWPSLFQRPQLNTKDVSSIVEEVFSQIQRQGDDAIRTYTQQFDGVHIENIEVSKDEMNAAEQLLSPELKSAIQLAKANIQHFHQQQLQTKQVIETSPGVHCWREQRPIEKVGLYIPGGTAPLFSSVLMLAIPAKLAGCKEIVLCSPPNQQGKLHPAILYAAQLVGITKLFTVGGIQAIGALTFGTPTIPAVYKIFGPGNQYVTAAKQLAQKHGVAIDMPAGPSELLVIAQQTAKASYVAADLLSQAEHGIDSQVILLTTSKQLVSDVSIEIEKQLEALPRQSIAKEALSHSKAIVMNSLDECFFASNLYAPEHLILAMDQPENYTEKIINAGSVFLGHYSCESLGDYASGTNHTLPTNGFAKAYSGVSLDSFCKQVTFQQVNEIGIKSIGPAVEQMAAAEQLHAHKYAVTVRLNDVE